jgi:5-bromo-4-chloroindolyl phosphate hydrolysis protein
MPSVTQRGTTNVMFREVTAGVVGGATFLAFWVPLHVPLTYSVGAGLVTYVGALLLSSRRKPRFLPQTLEGMSSESVERALEEVNAKLKEIQGYTERVDRADFKRKLKLFCQRGRQICEEIERDPRGLKSIRSFMGYILETTGKIVKSYIELSSHRVVSESVGTTLDKLEHSIDLVNKALDVQLTKLLQNDMLNLDVELDVLRKTLSMEGIQ